MKKIIIGLCLSVVTIFSWAGWPNKPVTLIIPFGPGSQSTQVANDMQIVFEAKFGMPLVVKYMPGGGQSIAANYMLSEKNDDHTIMQISDDFITSQYVQGTHLYNQTVPLNITATFGSYVYGNADASLEKFKESVKNKKPVNMGNLSVNGGYDIWSRQLKLPGLVVNPVPYKGAAQMQTDVLGGHLEYGISVLSTAKDFVDEGKIKIIMSTTLERNHVYKNVPTFKELGIQGEAYYGFYGWITRKDTSPEAVEAMSKFLKEWVQSSQVVANQGRLGMTVSNADGEKAQKIINDTIKRLDRMLKQ